MVNTTPWDAMGVMAGVLEDAEVALGPASGSEAAGMFTSNCDALDCERESEG